MEKVEVKYMKINKKRILILVLILLVVSMGITFAVFSTGGVQSDANTFRSGCLDITIQRE